MHKPSEFTFFEFLFFFCIGLGDLVLVYKLCLEKESKFTNTSIVEKMLVRITSSVDGIPEKIKRQNAASYWLNQPYLCVLMLLGARIS